MSTNGMTARVFMSAGLGTCRRVPLCACSSRATFSMHHAIVDNAWSSSAAREVLLDATAV